MDATAVKAEIKTWEHEFRAHNGRSATIEDVKALPHIAEKYKLYKKLTKEVVHIRGERRADLAEPPRTPSPHEGRTRLLSSDAPAAILPKSRPVASSSKIETKNPFSPVKKTQWAAPKPSSSTNPFLTPVKATRTPSPDPFLPSQSAPSPSVRQNAAIVKARKRLRGESVSPSPLPRDKRRRATGLDPPAYAQGRSISPPDHTAEEASSFVDDSPVKPPAGVKAFSPLFKEAMPLSQPTHSKASNLTIRGRALSRAKTLPSNLFGAVKKDVKDVEGGRAILEVTPAGASKTYTNGKGKRKQEERSLDGAHKAKKKKALPGPKGLIPSKDDLFEDPPPTASTSTGTSRKRSLSKVTEYGKHGNQDEGLTSNRWGLLPPSPPPQNDDAGRYNPKGKGKTRDAPQRRNKKARVSAADEDDAEDDATTSSEGVEVNVVAWRGGSHSPQSQETDLRLTVDPELKQFHLRTGSMDAAAESALPSLESFEVDLPEEMRRVLAFSPHDGAREMEEEDLVNGLMRGRRRAGGEVWAPGEVGGEEDGTKRVSEEDEWEGEGVPWEVAEL
ncbi:hypothetical protein JB92DRAFT_3104585 [Gautieria morchelliformis]|nr:hypothetical protein JB92DRAFT_3104585 [Gautieria morchelliformis]